MSELDSVVYVTKSGRVVHLQRKCFCLRSHKVYEKTLRDVMAEAWKREKERVMRTGKAPRKSEPRVCEKCRKAISERRKRVEK
jgi:hypothetical protein